MLTDIVGTVTHTTHAEAGHLIQRARKVTGARVVVTKHAWSGRRKVDVWVSAGLVDGAYKHRALHVVLEDDGSATWWCTERTSGNPLNGDRMTVLRRP